MYQRSVRACRRARRSSTAAPRSCVVVVRRPSARTHRCRSPMRACLATHATPSAAARSRGRCPCLGRSRALDRGFPPRTASRGARLALPLRNREADTIQWNQDRSPESSSGVSAWSRSATVSMSGLSSVAATMNLKSSKKSSFGVAPLFERPAAERDRLATASPHRSATAANQVSHSFSCACAVRCHRVDQGFARQLVCFQVRFERLTHDES